MQDEPELPGSPEATETRVERGGSISEASGEESVPLGDRGSQEKPRKEKPSKGEKLKKEKPRREKPRREDKSQVTGEPRQSLPRRWEAREGGRRPWGRDSRDLLEHGKLQAWAPRRRHDRDDRPRQKRPVSASQVPGSHLTLLMMLCNCEASEVIQVPGSPWKAGSSNNHRRQLPQETQPLSPRAQVSA